MECWSIGLLVRTRNCRESESQPPVHTLPRLQRSLDLIDGLVAVRPAGSRHPSQYRITPVLQSSQAPWHTCEATLSETFFVASAAVRHVLVQMLRRYLLVSDFRLAEEQEAVLTLMDKYRNVPMSLADACLVRMTETMAAPVILSTDTDFLIYLRHSRQVVPCLLPP